jgi:hypothetical protein
LSAGELQEFLPARGRFTFPSPYSTIATRLTNAADCGGGDCVNYVGYAYWSNINNHVGSEAMLIFLGLDRSRGGLGPSLFSYNKTTGDTRNLGPLFESTNPLSWATGEGWYFSATRASALYLNDGPRMLRYDVLARTLETVFDARPLIGRNDDVYIWQMHSSADDQAHSATVKVSGTFQPLGCVTYREDTGQSHFFPAIGDFDECQIDKTGRWLVIKDNLDGRNGEDNRIIDLQTGFEQAFYDEDGAAGHSDVGFGYLVAEDDHASQPGAARVWKFSESVHASGQGTLVYHLTSWSSGLGHLAHGNARPEAPLEQQTVCSSNATRLALPRVNEIVCYRLDDSLQALVVAPNMTDLNASGGGDDDYSKLPKGNRDVTGEYFIWTSNTGTNRLDAFIVHVPQWKLTGVPTVTADSATPSSGTGGAQTFALRYSSTAGATSVSEAWVWFNATFATTAANSCLVYYRRSAHELRLLNDAGTTWMSATLGTAATLENNQCAIAAGDSSVALAGNTLTVNLAMTFKASFAGVKNIYMYGAVDGVASGWQDRGDWTVPAGAVPSVTADSVNPPSGSGTAQTFALQYSSSAGATSVSEAWVWFNATFATTAANSCLIFYERATQVVWLLNDAGTTWVAGAPGVTSTLQNSQCAIALANNGVVLSGNTLTLSLAITFTASFSGVKNVYMYGAAGSAASGWQDRGDWTAP